MEESAVLTPVDLPLTAWIVSVAADLGVLLAVIALTLAVTALALRSPSSRAWIAGRRWLHPNAVSVYRIVLGIALPFVIFFDAGVSDSDFTAFLGDEPWFFGFAVRTIIDHSAMIVLGLAIASDAVDGMIARACGLVSETGKWLDPLADKIVYLPAFVVFAFLSVVVDGGLGFLPLFTLFVLFEVVGTFIRPWLARAGYETAANPWGKMKLVLVFVPFSLCVVQFLNLQSEFLFGSRTLLALYGMCAVVLGLAILSVVAKIPLRK